MLVICTVASALAQTKSQQVERYLGTYRYKNDRPVGVVKFIFQSAVLKRSGDSHKTYEYLLLNEPYFSNEDNAGHLIGVQLVHNGRVVTIRPEAPDKSGDDPNVSVPTAHASTNPSAQPDPVRPKSNAVQGPGNTKDFLPDSAKIADNINHAKQKITGWQGRMWQTVRPMWEFVMWMFNSVIILLICFGGLCRYVAKTAASESLINTHGRVIVGRWIVAAHQNAAALLLLITWIIAIVMLIDVFMWLVYLNIPVWTLVVIWFPILWIAEKLTNWIVPNIPVIGPGGNVR
jgi:hypothetical protein